MSAAAAAAADSTGLTDEAFHARPDRQAARLDELIEDVGLELMQLFQKALTRLWVCGSSNCK